MKQKPSHERQRVAFASAFVLTSIIALVWLSTMLVGSSETAQTAQVEGPIDSVIRQALGVFGW